MQCSEPTSELSGLVLERLNMSNACADGSFMCFYGSSIYKVGAETSDLDFFVHVPEGFSGEVDDKSVIDCVVDYHARTGRKIDEEVPYTNKLIYETGEIIGALCYKGFMVEGESITVPEVQKTTAFLASPEVKLRLAFNALTTPHRVRGVAADKAAELRRCAEIAATLLGVCLSTATEIRTSDVMQALDISKTGKTGEDFLGYKMHYSAVRQYVAGFVASCLETLTEDEALVRQGDSYSLKYGIKPSIYMFGLTSRGNIS